MSLKKQFLKSKPVCKVTFTLEKDAAAEAQTVLLVGDFNNWDAAEGIELKKQKNGSFKATLELESGKEYQFRYLLDGRVWENDWAADKYVPTGMGADNSVVSTVAEAELSEA